MTLHFNLVTSNLQHYQARSYGGNRGQLPNPKLMSCSPWQAFTVYVHMTHLSFSWVGVCLLGL